VRHILRTLMTSALIATIAVSGTAAVASAAPQSGNGISYEMYEDWCFDDITVLFCFEVHGRLTIVEQDDGDQIGTAAVRTLVYVIESGQVTSAAVDHSVYQTKFVDGFAQDELLISVGRALTPGEQCVLRMLLRFEDGVVVIDRSSISCN
jgi:hypothetical protein